MVFTAQLPPGNYKHERMTTSWSHMPCLSVPMFDIKDTLPVCSKPMCQFNLKTGKKYNFLRRLFERSDRGMCIKKEDYAHMQEKKMAEKVVKSAEIGIKKCYIVCL